MAQNGVTEVGKYRVIEQIGEGAMGVVYRALDPVLNRTVAIKVMSDALARDDELRSRFLREAQAAGSLQHPNLVTIYDFGEVGGHLYIAMEFVAGRDLEGLLRNNTPLTVVDKIDILIDVLGGLGYAHKRGVVHRDIKPANIRIDDEGRARIMDFGIAHLQSSTLTRTGLMVGTPAYMAPEQVTGGVVSAQTDIFAVGAVMYELFTGTKPFEGESLQSVFYKIVSQAPLEFSAIAPNIPASLNIIAMHALAKDPAVRYSSAGDMAAALTDARARLDRVSSRPKAVSLNSSLATGLQSRVTRPIRAQRRPSSQLLLAGGGGALLLVATVGIVVTLSSRNSTASKSAEPDAAPPATQPLAAQPVTQPVAQPVTPPATPVTQPPPQAPASSPPVVAQSASGTSSSKAAERAAPKTAPKTTAAGPSADELALFRSLQAAALESRRRASEAGASTEHLREGDDHSQAAMTAVQQGKVTDAATQLNLASAAWGAAERDARAAAAARARAAAEPKPDPVVPPVVANAAVSAQQQPVAPPPATVRPPAPTPQAEIAAVISAYERAIESRDLAELRRAYPGMTQAQTKAWSDFLNTLRSIRASLSVGGLDVKGDAAEARITGTYDYVTTAGKTVQQPANFQAAFRREGGAWRLTAVR